MIGTSIWEYGFIRASILALRAITPASILYTAVSVFRPPRSLIAKGFLAYAVVESAFYLLVYLPRRQYLQKEAVHPTLLSRSDRQELFNRCVENIPDGELYLQKWFLSADAAEIKRENVKEFLRWAFLNSAERNFADEEELDGYVHQMEGLLGRKIPEGKGKAKCLRLTVDKVHMLHRPLVWYATVGLVDTLTAAYLRYHSFTLYRTPLRHFFGLFPFRVASLFTRRVSLAPNLSYWYKPHTSRTKLPVLFVHGIGIGLYSYAQFLAEINKHQDIEDGDGDGEIGIIALEIMPISFRLTRSSLSSIESCAQINAILSHHGWDRVVLVSHSYGSVISTHLLHNTLTAPKISRMLLTDPVTFLLHLPDIAYNFTARQPRQANEHQLYYFASKDMMVAHTLHRHFFWAENILWKEDLKGRDVTVSLAGRDLIVDTETVGKYLTGTEWEDESGTWKAREWSWRGLDVLWWPREDHAQVFERKGCRKVLGDVVRRYAAGRAHSSSIDSEA